MKTAGTLIPSWQPPLGRRHAGSPASHPMSGGRVSVVGRSGTPTTGQRRRPMRNLSVWWTVAQPDEPLPAGRVTTSGGVPRGDPRPLSTVDWTFTHVQRRLIGGVFA